jgi:hypothetical protein
MVASFAAWLAFYELRPAMLLAKLQTLVTPAAYQPAALREALGYYHGSGGFVLGSILFLAMASLGLEWRSVADQNEPYRLLRQPRLLLFIVALTVAVAPTKHNEFIYFAF